MKFQFDDIRGGWAVVTGASSGIGREFALQLGRRGLNLLLVARRETELKAVATEVAGISGMRVLPLVLDIASPLAAEKVVQSLGEHGGAHLRLLVSNAGIGLWGPHDSELRDAHDRIVAVNVGGLVSMTTALLPLLLASRPSALVHVSSQAAFQPVPYMAVYAASKAFVHSFSLALHEELREQGVLVQTLVPAPTATEFDAKAGAYQSAVSARGSCADVVGASLAALDRGDAVATNASGVWKQRLFAGLAPPKMIVREVGKMFKPPGSSR